MKTTSDIDTLIVGAGITGLSMGAFLKGRDFLILEADSQIGGYCKTIHQDGFVWDYSGHFFHFKHPDIEAWLRERMGNQRLRTVNKKSFISYAGKWIDFPFQKNIHQLPTAEFIECLHDAYFAEAAARVEARTEHSFKEMLFSRLGRGICEKFLIPYNEKLYACDLATLDKDAMGRFFPHAKVADIIRNMHTPDNSSYNSTFTYPEGGAFEYVKAIASEVPSERISLNEALVSVDLDKRIARTSKRELRYQKLVSSAPLNRFVAKAGLPSDTDAFAWNKVLVFNLGFDRKGPTGVHWLYVPDRQVSFYRVGFYDNIFDADRMSLYVELGFSKDAQIDIPAQRERVLADLKTQGIVDAQRLVAHHAVVMDPAYVHITRKSLAEQKRLAQTLNAQGVYSIGRYGGWTYCSIEDNIVEARALAAALW